MEDLSFAILPLEFNRVERFYVGGNGIDKWRKMNPNGDSNLCEDMMVNTARYIGPGKPFDFGYSQTIVNGKRMRLENLIIDSPTEFLGEKYANLTDGQSGIMCRVGDSVNRLILQYHPTDFFANKYLNVKKGKTEAWYILDTRDDEGSFCYVGFNKGSTKAEFVERFEKGDYNGMLGMLHKIPYKKGDIILVKSGTVHAMGGGTTFLELHPSCDYTFRLEKMFDGNLIQENDLHYGLGKNLLFDGIDYTTYSDDEIMRKVLSFPKLVDEQKNSKLFNLLDYDLNEEFKIDKLCLNGEFKFSVDDTHLIVIAIVGDTKITSLGNSVILEQGRAAFVPANAAKDLTFYGENTEVIMGFPFEVKL